MSRATRVLLRLLLIAALAATVVIGLSPRATEQLEAPGWRPSHPYVSGAIHVHTVKSDGAGDANDIAAAAARAGLSFVVLTDHGNAAQPVDPPTYLSGVLVISAVEISTTGGHYLALDAERSPYPLSGEPRDVVEDVARLGGFGVAAHPGSQKSELAWQDWDAPIDGLEWINQDSEWRDESWARISRAFVSYFWRGPEAIASLLDRPVDVLARWDALAKTRNVAALPGHDAHARIGFGRHREAYGSGLALSIPSYEAVFRAFAANVELDRPFSGVAAEDAAALMRALRGGRVVTTLTATASPAVFEFSAQAGEAPVRMGERLPRVVPASFHVRVKSPSGSRVVLLRDGAEVAESDRDEIVFAAPPIAAAYRVEVRAPRAPGRPPTPWLVSNPIYIGPATAPTPTPTPEAVARAQIFDRGDAGGWDVERDPGSTGRVEAVDSGDAHELALQYALAPGVKRGQYVALTRNTPGQMAGFDRIAFRVRAAAPMRLSVQLRLPWPDGRRWARSVYVDQSARSIAIPVADMHIAGPPGDPIEGRAVQALLFVVDTVNTAPGASGVVYLSDVRYER